MATYPVTHDSSIALRFRKFYCILAPLAAFSKPNSRMRQIRKLYRGRHHITGICGRKNKSNTMRYSPILGQISV